LKFEIKNIVVIGSGNVAWHLINAYTGAGIKVVQVLAHDEKKAARLSKAFSVPFILDATKLYKEADLYLLAVQDDQIVKTAASLGLTGQFLVHTSGFSSLDAIAGASEATGVLWPLQTLTAGRKVDYRKIPLLIEASTKELEENLLQFANVISPRVIATDSQIRQRIHLAAVIASNLANHLYTISAAILDRQGIAFDILGPLILETASKATLNHPLKSQTGPAARRDLKVIEKHLELLRDEPDYFDIYRMISENISHTHSSNP